MNLHSYRNPYEEAELFVMLERLRRQGNLDEQMDNELGELLISATRYAMTCGLRKGLRFDDDDAFLQCTLYAVEASRKASTENPHSFVSYLIAAVQTNWMRDSGTERNRQRMLLPVCGDKAVELSVGFDGDPDGIAPWETLRLFAIKQGEEDGSETSGRRPRRGKKGTGRRGAGNSPAGNRRGDHAGNGSRKRGGNSRGGTD